MEAALTTQGKDVLCPTLMITSMSGAQLALDLAGIGVLTQLTDWAEQRCRLHPSSAVGAVAISSTAQPLDLVLVL